MGQSRTSYAVHWWCNNPPSQRILECELGWVGRRDRRIYVAYSASGRYLGTFPQRKQAMLVVERAGSEPLGKPQ